MVVNTHLPLIIHSSMQSSYLLGLKCMHDELHQKFKVYACTFISRTLDVT